jgi:hypothetical protein
MRQSRFIDGRNLQVVEQVPGVLTVYIEQQKIPTCISTCIGTVAALNLIEDILRYADTHKGDK